VNLVDRSAMCIGVTLYRRELCHDYFIGSVSGAVFV
jgi:hypothetical protein